ncbi:cardiolipin synthase isoform X1 [Leptinotarsa decemlineata]|uniref:cardiolipin synthase isoform X1 n=1 Tax=Leptinotarsa decemlineata TaxID=7539 RepID=UPI003D309A5C
MLSKSSRFVWKIIQCRTIVSCRISDSKIISSPLPINPNQHLRYSLPRLYCSSNKNPYIAHDTEVIPKGIKNIDKKPEKLKNTEQDREIYVFQDLKESKKKFKEKIEEVVERENVYTIPNFLCVARIAISPYLGWLIVQSEYDFALVVLVVAAVTDLLDGWIARKWISQSSKMGSFLDPMADKVLIGILFLSLTYVNLIPVFLTGLIIARDVILVMAGFVIRYKSLPPPRTLSRYFDVSHATAQLAPTFISKVNTGVQLLLVGSTLSAPVFHYVGHPFLEYLWFATGATTVAAALSYILSKDTYRILKKHK